MSLNDLDGLLGVTPKKNRTYTICAMCSEKKDYKSLYEELLIKQEYQNEMMVEFMKSDSCNDFIEDKEWKTAIKHLHQPYDSKIVHFIFYPNPPEYPFCKMITLTFDPKKFKRLINRNAQRAYMEQTLNELINKDTIEELYGCYELHENGNVHVHFLTTQVWQYDVLDFLKYKFTDKKDNIHAVHCCDKNFYEAVAYINKPETKDKNCDYNFFVWQKNSRNFKISSNVYAKRQVSQIQEIRKESDKEEILRSS